MAGTASFFGLSKSMATDNPEDPGSVAKNMEDNRSLSDAEKNLKGRAPSAGEIRGGGANLLAKNSNRSQQNQPVRSAAATDAPSPLLSRSTSPSSWSAIRLA